MYPARTVFPDTDPEDDEQQVGRFKPSLGRYPLGTLTYTAEEFIAIQIALKLRTNMSDAIFTSQISAIAKGLEDASVTLPATRHKAEQQLACMSQCKRQFVVYCDPCLEIYGTYNQIPKKKAMNCRKCGTNLTNLTSQGNSYFIILSIRKQIEGYLKDKKFLSLLKSCKCRKEGDQFMNGLLHKEIASRGHFDLSLGIDAAQLHKTHGKSIIPVVLFFNNIPISWQLRYPVLAALWTGNTTSKPPRMLLLEHMIGELKELGTRDPIMWQDLEGQNQASLVFLTTVISDAPEKADLLNQNGTNGTYACPYCKASGETITIQKYPRVFKDNMFRRTKGKEAIQGTRYPKFVHEDRDANWRKNEDRVAMGLKVADRIDKTGKDYKEEGIKGLPVLLGLPGTFGETDSHVSDHLHLIGEGVLKDIMHVMMGVTTKGSSGNMFLANRRSWKIFEDMRSSMTSTSECDRNCTPMINYSAWKAYDYWEFAMHNTAQLCSDETIITNTQIYDCLMHLANIGYLWHLDQVTPEIIEQTREEVKKFCKCFRAVFTEEFMTYKAHVLQHIPDFMALHGSGNFTDAFNLERFISCCKKLMTTTRAHAGQITRNFLLKHQSPILYKLDSFSETAKEVLRENGVFNEEFFSKFGNVIKKQHAIQDIPDDKKRVLSDFIKTSMKKDLEQLHLTRVVQMCRDSIILESEQAKHRANSKIDDSFIQVEGSIFGRIVEIFHCLETDRFIIMMRKYERIYPRQSGCLIEYPLNQFPYRKPPVDDYFTFFLTDNILIQKAKVGRTSYFHGGQQVRLFTVRPSFHFRF